MSNSFTPEPTPEQAVRVLKILGEWTRRGLWYDATLVNADEREHTVVCYSNPEPDLGTLSAFGVNHFDALCQATAAMQILLELHPEKES